MSFLLTKHDIKSFQQTIMHSVSGNFETYLTFLPQRQVTYKPKQIPLDVYTRKSDSGFLNVC